MKSECPEMNLCTKSAPQHAILVALADADAILRKGIRRECALIQESEKHIPKRCFQWIIESRT